MDDIVPDIKKLKAAEEAGHKILLLSRGYTTDGQAQYTYLSLPPTKLIAFKEAEAEGNFSYEDFGEVLYSGEGLEPPDEVKKEMEKKYGFNHNFEEQLMEKAKEIRKKHQMVEKYAKPKKDEW
jgi:hypothetical protein